MKKSLFTALFTVICFIMTTILVFASDININVNVGDKKQPAQEVKKPEEKKDADKKDRGKHLGQKKDKKNKKDKKDKKEKKDKD